MHDRKVQPTTQLAPGQRRALRPVEAAEFLGISRATLYRLVKSGALPPPRRLVGMKSPRHDVLALQRYLDQSFNSAE